MRKKLTTQQSDEIADLAARHRGDFGPAVVLEASADPQSSLHHFVGWDQSEDDLAKRYRLERARLAIMLWQLKAQEVMKSEAYKERTKEEKAYLKLELDRLQAAGARRTWSDPEERGKGGSFKDVVDIIADQQKRYRLTLGIIEELEAFVNSRMVFCPQMHNWGLAMVQQARTKFVHIQGQREAS